MIIALVVTPEGLPLAYEVLPGNATDKTTLRAFLSASNGNTARRAASG
jgi:transposase